MSSIQNMLDYAKGEPHPYLVVMIDEAAGGIRIKAESKEACELMAKILGPFAKAIPREEFIQKMEEEFKEQANAESYSS